MRHPQARRFHHVRVSRLLVAGALASLAFGANACDRSPLLAPSGSAITIIATDTLGANDSTSIVVTVIEGASATGQNGNTTTVPGAGTPVHDGTIVLFSATLGQVVPAEAKTVKGTVTVTFVGDGRTGKTIISAISGPANKTKEIILQ